MFLFGNGIGMAADGSNFRLDEAMKESWSVFSQESKNIVRNILKIFDKDDCPKSEHQLHSLQIFLWYIEEQKITEYTNLVAEMRGYVFNVASKFAAQNSNMVNQKPIFNSLKSFVRNNSGNTAISTTNYDVLLYGTLFGSGVNIILYDPFLGGKEKFWEEYSCYITLHGCPLFIKEMDSGNVEKVRIEKFQQECKTTYFDKIKNGEIDAELILTSEYLKIEEIKKHSLLADYWNRFTQLLTQTNVLLCVGYSGEDPHINDEISKVSGMAVLIIEYNFDPSLYDKDVRKLFWQSKLKTKQVFLYECPDILEANIEEIISNWQQNENSKK